eukprot:scaffold7427_cov162-Cylindrotheca_fusiformis.AAC.1
MNILHAFDADTLFSVDLRAGVSSDVIEGAAVGSLEAAAAVGSVVTEVAVGSLEATGSLQELARGCGWDARRSGCGIGGNRSNLGILLLIVNRQIDGFCSQNLTIDHTSGIQLSIDHTFVLAGLARLLLDVFKVCSFFIRKAGRLT